MKILFLDDVATLAFLVVALVKSIKIKLIKILRDLYLPGDPGVLCVHAD